MKLNDQSELYLPFNQEPEQYFKTITHMVFAAHQDDIEIMAQHGILSCFDDPKNRFAATVCSDGGGSPRTGIYGNYTNEEMKRVRILEQKKAAMVGNYSLLVLLNYSSAQIKDPCFLPLLEDLKILLQKTRPKVIYTHNPADKHDTHVAVSLRVITALQELSSTYRPDIVYGCEVWRGLDWINDDEKVVLDVSGHPSLRASLLGVFDSQIEGGKRYDLAALGRQAANATFYSSHETDKIDAAIYAVDLTPLLAGRDVCDYMNGYIQRFSLDINERIKRLK